jgi:hypothetical protein
MIVCLAKNAQPTGITPETNKLYWALFRTKRLFKELS